MPLPNRPAKTYSVFEVLAEVRRVNQKLFWNATYVYASASEITLFGYRDPGAVGSRHAARAHAAGTCANGEEVVIVLRHVKTLLLQMSDNDRRYPPFTQPVVV